MEALEKALSHIYSATSHEDWQIAAMCHGLIMGYHERWKDEQEEIQLMQTEQCYTSPLRNPETGRDSRTFTLAGVLDKIARSQSEAILFDHKTTSEDISDPTAPYWRQLAIDSQAAHYELLLLLNGKPLDNIIWDVVRKPGIRPKKISKKDKTAAIESGIYHGFRICGITREWLEEEERENGTLYAFRLARETMENPERYFARRSNVRSRSQLVEYSGELWDCAKTLRQAQLENLHFKNPGACFNYGRPCEFLGLCSGVDDPTSENWQPKPKKHAELPEGIGGPRVLTNSRMRCFHTCRRKHYYKYELGIERVGAERQEALYFGSLWHQTLDVWWQAMNERYENGDKNEQPVGSIGSQSQLVG